MSHTCVPSLLFTFFHLPDLSTMFLSFSLIQEEAPAAAEAVEAPKVEEAAKVEEVAPVAPVEAAKEPEVAAVAPVEEATKTVSY